MNKKELEAFAKQAAKGIKSESDLNDFRSMLTKVTVEAALNAELEQDILKANGIELKAVFCVKKGAFYIHKEIAELLGVSFNSRLRAICLNVWISPIKDIAYKYCSMYSSGHFEVVK